MSLTTRLVWVVGGAGSVGQGLARGLLKAGATVIVNSRHQRLLQRMQEEIGGGSAEGRLVTVNRSMLPGSAEETVRIVLDMTGSRLDHVVAHSGVAWWSPTDDEGAVRGGNDESSTAYSSSGSVLEVPAAEFGACASQLGAFHHSAAQLLLPRLARDSGSYTFVTSRESMYAAHRGTGMAQINAHAVMGLAAALRQEASDAAWPFARVNELRLGGAMQINRPMSERQREPRSRPLSHDIGEIVAGMAASSADGGLCGTHAGPVCVSASSPAELEVLRAQYEAAHAALHL